MKKPQTWRELLKKVIDDPREKERLARSLDVNALTLTRWVNRQSTPRPDNLGKLLNALRPQHSALFRELLAAEFRDTTEKLLSSETEPLTISSSFYAQILGELADTDRSQHTWSLCQTILQHALAQFDPYHQGLILAIMNCTPPAQDNTVRSLYTPMSLATSPWTATPLQFMFFGMESLAGYVVSSCRASTIEDCQEEQGRRLFRPIENANSLAAYPIKQFSRVAGCLWSASTQAGYFTPERLMLLKHYADLLALAFTFDTFYEPERLVLGIMPPDAVQYPSSSTFRQRLVQVARAAVDRAEPLSNSQAEQIALQSLEKEYLLLSPTPQQ
jgi:GAF domain-containing protein